MDKKILEDYIDAKELIKETEQDIRRMKQRKKTVIQTNVKGSNPNFPYQEQYFRVQGTTFTYQDDSNLRLEENLLVQRKQNAEKVKKQVEEWMLTIPMRIQRIIQYKVFDGLTWEQTAARIGRKATGDGIRKEFQRFMEEN